MANHLTCCKLAKDTREGNEPVVVVVCIQGIVADLDLPPISQYVYKPTYNVVNDTHS